MGMEIDYKSLAGLMVKDPLSEVARKDRRALLGISVIGIVIVKANIMPTKLTAFGIEFGKTDQNFLLFAILLITAYFLFAFVLYSLSDFLAFQIEWAKLFKEREEINSGKIPKEDVGKVFYIRRYLNKHLLFYLIRGLFEFLFPIIIGIYAIVILWTADIQPTKIFF
ncbi:hypothetical protein LCGC14_3001480 [marine sediment metagenome]|uniref:Uncharacterized protein n=1 Tax=marine sediment metagenome TaxID=412755 RepID=A0A0F8X1C3_9ZZZZ